MLRLFSSILTLLTLISCGQSYKEQQQASAQQHREALRQDSLALKVATTPTLDCLPLFIAQRDSLFAQQGVKVHLVHRHARLDGDTLMMGRHVEGQVTDLVRLQWLAHHGVPTQPVAVTGAHWQLLAAKMARVTRASQLTDKMVAMARHSATEWVTNQCLRADKPKGEVFRIQVNDVGVRMRMMLNHEMDAAVLTEPQATVLRLHGAKVLYDTRSHDLQLGVMAFRKDIMADARRKQQLRSFMRAYRQACDSLRIHGLMHYASLIQHYMGVDARTLKAIPTPTFPLPKLPREKDWAAVQQHSIDPKTP